MNFLNEAMTEDMLETVGGQNCLGSWLQRNSKTFKIIVNWVSRWLSHSACKRIPNFLGTFIVKAYAPYEAKRLRMLSLTLNLGKTSKFKVQMSFKT